MALTEVQLQHVDRVLRLRAPRSPEEFIKVLDERTPVRSFFRWRWDNGAAAAAERSARDCFLQRLTDTISSLYASGAPDWHTQVTSYLQQQHEELDRMFGTYEEQYQRNTREWMRFGAIQVAPAQPLQVLLGKYPRLLERLGPLGLAPETQAIQVHVPTRFTQGGESPWEEGRTILQLARHLKTVEGHYRALGVRALFGLSWQFDSVIGRRLGFTVVDSPDLPQNIMGAWYQLLNEDGSFNEKRLGHLLRHNVLPYRLKCGVRLMTAEPDRGA